MSFVDLRSDTVTRPTAAMRKAMADAEVGDDVYGEDPTVNRLQETFAARVGKDAALFVPSGTMGNQLALRLLAPPGTTVIAGARQHIVIYESGAAARNTGIQFHVVDDSRGTIDPAAVSWAVEAAKHHYPTPSVVAVENTHMPADGAPWDLGDLNAVTAVAEAAGLAVHMDGARLFHAEVATATSAAAYCREVTTVMCCLSKGLCAPVGSLLAGPADVMAEARRERQRLGGGMRQAGVLAAAGLVALETMVDRLAEDHERAAQLADAVQARWPQPDWPQPDWPQPDWPQPDWPQPDTPQPDTPQPDTRGSAGVRTNVVTFRHPASEGLLAYLHDEGILAGTIAPGVVRFVTHHDVDDEGIRRACKAIAAAPR